MLRELATNKKLVKNRKKKGEREHITKCFRKWAYLFARLWLTEVKREKSAVYPIDTEHT